ncbi:hypothetical protein BG015_003725 [Linnemannia schmuckeri]|uniref:FAD-binding domain-containing protein n=1 Tax=Linnemannia schmuckeri TaxID=64567 RepID=A0A9P5V2Y6_9FUNG|nr:hypothetical protein BG015_003725 [Linnemannia schmuckeri]
MTISPLPLTGINDKPRVLIVGAGLAGLTLAISLQKAGVPYNVFERGLETRTVGTAMLFGPNVGPLFTQLGIYDEFVEKSKPCETINIYDETRELQFTRDFKLTAEMGGYANRIIPRTALYSILLDKVPQDRIHKGKKMVSLYQDDARVIIYFADGSHYEGDILVGADGAYSAVRHCLYESVDRNGRLSQSDAEDLPYSCICLVGHSSSLDPVKFPSLRDEFCHYNDTHSIDIPYSWMTFTTKNDVICWGVIKYLDVQNSAAYSREQRSDWGEGATETMCNEVRGLPIPGGDGSLIMGDLIDGTPRSQITKVMLEEKVFDTWYHGRTVLVGDGNILIHPAGNRGAVQAFHDVVTLSNWINVLSRSATVEDIEPTFRAYKEERFPFVQEAAVHSKNLSQVSFTPDMKTVMSRFVTKHMPSWLWRVVNAKTVSYRPQASFLPVVKDSGTVGSIHPKSYLETLRILETRSSSVAAASAVVV